jgi:hypothetical protein
MAQKTIQIKVTIVGGFQHKGITYSLDDVSTEDFATGEYFIKAGWAVDNAGKISHPIPDKSEVILAPADILISIAPSEAN